jgi:hypothetical protein
VSEDPVHTYSRDAITARVRRNAGQAAFPALLVLLVGWLILDPPEDPQGLAMKVVAGMAWTLRICGFVLLIAAALCWTGAMIGFLLDAVTSSLVAIALVLATLVCLPQLNFVVLVFAVFAALYVRAAIALWRDYAALQAGLTAFEALGAGGEDSDGAPSPEEGSLAGALLEELRGSAPEPERDQPRADTEPDREPSEEPPPDGYLAGLAEEKKDKPGSDS